MLLAQGQLKSQAISNGPQPEPGGQGGAASELLAGLAVLSQLGCLAAVSHLTRLTSLTVDASELPYWQGGLGEDRGAAAADALRAAVAHGGRRGSQLARRLWGPGCAGAGRAAGAAPWSATEAGALGGARAGWAGCWAGNARRAPHGQHAPHPSACTSPSSPSPPTPPTHAHPPTRTHTHTHSFRLWCGWCPDRQRQRAARGRPGAAPLRDLAGPAARHRGGGEGGWRGGGRMAPVPGVWHVEVRARRAVAVRRVRPARPAVRPGGPRGSPRHATNCRGRP
jgi:hypothetical protein